MTEPLGVRVVAPATELPADTDGIHWRAATDADLDALHELERDVAPVDHPHYVITREEFEDDFEASFFDPQRDSLVAVDDDGTILAWGVAVMPPGRETLVRSILAGSVRPSARGRGIGRQLFAWQRRRGEQQLAASDSSLPGWLITFIADGVTDAQHLYEREGLSLARYFLELGRDVREAIPDAPAPAGLRVVPLTAELSEAARIARNDAFRDHWGSQPTDREVWDTFIARGVTRLDLSWLAIGMRDGVEEVAGFVITSVNEEDWEGQGFSSAYIDLVGVPRAWRGRGIAPVLLAQTLRSVAAAGLDKAVLDVDAENPSGALGLYTGLGFAESHRSLSYVREY